MFEAHPTNAPRFIASIVPDGFEAAQCIRIAHPSRLYVTDDFIPTHNTYFPDTEPDALPFFSATGQTTLADEMKRWAGRLDGLFKGGMDAVASMGVPAVLKELGVKANALTLTKYTVKKVAEDHPEITPEMLSRLPEMLSDPLAAYPYSDKKAPRGTRSGLTVIAQTSDAKGNPVRMGVRFDDGKITTIFTMPGGMDAIAAHMKDALAEFPNASTYLRDGKAAIAGGFDSAIGRAASDGGLRRAGGVTAPYRLNSIQALFRNRKNVITRADLVKSYGQNYFQQAPDSETLYQQSVPGTAPPTELNIIGLKGRGVFERNLERLRRAVQDRNVTIQRLQKIAGITRDDIKLNLSGALDRVSGKIQVAQEKLVNDPMKKMNAALEKAYTDKDAATQDLGDLLIAEHVPEYNAWISRINPVKYDSNGNYVAGFDAAHPGSGITDAAAAQTIQRLTGKNDAKAKALREAQVIYRQMINDMQDYAVAQGLEKQAVIDAWRQYNPNYAPFQRVMDDESQGTLPGSSGFSLRAGVSREAMGSSREIINPLASTTLYGVKLATRGENAVVTRTLLAFAQAFTPKYQNGAGDWKPMWQVNKLDPVRRVKTVNVYQTLMADGKLSPEFYNKVQANKFADTQQGIWVKNNPGKDPATSGIVVQELGPQRRVIVSKNPLAEYGENVITVPVDGENQMIVFDKASEDAQAILEGLKGDTKKPGQHPILFAARLFSKWTMVTSTGFNPVFSIFNAARDVSGSMISLGGDDIPGWTKADSLSLAKDFLPAAKQIYTNKGEWAKWMEEAKNAGGLTGIGQSIYDTASAEDEVRRIFGGTRLARIYKANEANDIGSRMYDNLLSITDAAYRFGQGETRGGIAGWASRNVAHRVVFNSCYSKSPLKDLCVIKRAFLRLTVFFRAIFLRTLRQNYLRKKYAKSAIPHCRLWLYHLDSPGSPGEDIEKTPCQDSTAVFSPFVLLSVPLSAGLAVGFFLVPGGGTGGSCGSIVSRLFSRM